MWASRPQIFVRFFLVTCGPTCGLTEKVVAVEGKAHELDLKVGSEHGRGGGTKVRLGATASFEAGWPHAGIRQAV